MKTKAYKFSAWVFPSNLNFMGLFLTILVVADAPILFVATLFDPKSHHKASAIGWIALSVGFYVLGRISGVYTKTPKKISAGVSEDYRRDFNSSN